MSWSDLEILDEGRPVTGSERGVLVLDQEHELGARISLEQECRVAPFAITCGIYGWMFHTRFFGSEREAREQYALMREALDAILAGIPYDDDPKRDEKKRATLLDIETFVARFP
jgi:hypothetical protein